MTGDSYGDTADQQITHSMERHEMSETHRAFRERITQTGWDAVDGTDDGSTMPLVCLAVYREALGDVIAELEGYVLLANPVSDGATRTAIDVIEEFAAERGIDLGGDGHE